MALSPAAKELRRKPCTCGKNVTHYGPHREGCPKFIDRSQARDIREALIDRRHNEREGEWVSLAEFHRIDLFSMRLWSEWPDAKLSERSGLARHEPFHRRVAYEVKTSRSDFRLEIRRPQKRAEAVAMTHQWFFATPPGLVKRGELPEECGLVEVSPGGDVKVVRHAPIRRPTKGLNMHDVASLLRAKHLGPSVRDLRTQASRAAGELQRSQREFEFANDMLARARIRLIREKGSLLKVGSEWIGPRALVPGMSRRKGLPAEVRVALVGVSVYDGYDEVGSRCYDRVSLVEAERYATPYPHYDLPAGDFLIAFRHAGEPERVAPPEKDALWMRRRQPLQVIEGGAAAQSDDIAF